MNQFFIAYKSSQGDQGFRVFADFANTHEEIGILINGMLDKIAEEIGAEYVIATAFNRI